MCHYSSDKQRERKKQRQNRMSLSTLAMTNTASSEGKVAVTEVQLSRGDVALPALRPPKQLVGGGRERFLTAMLLRLC